jgi:hypothetical protein
MRATRDRPGASTLSGREQEIKLCLAVARTNAIVRVQRGEQARPGPVRFSLRVRDMLVRARVPEAPSQTEVDYVHGARGLACAEHKVGGLDVSMCLPIPSVSMHKDGR